MITIERNIDIISGKVPEVIHLSQYDSDFVLVFHLYASNGALVIASGTTAKIRGTKTDGNGYSAEATLSGTDATVQGHVQMTAVAGRQIFEICLMQGEKELNTANFVIDVERAAMDKDTLESDSVLLEAYAIIDRTDEIVAAARLAADSVETIRQDAEDARAAAESTAEDRAAVNRKAEQIIAVTTEADKIAAEALDTANNAENHMASLDSKMNDIEAQLENVSIDPDDLGLYQDEDTMFVYPTYRGVRSENGIPLASKGGGGGGGETVNAKFDADNISGFVSKTIPYGEGGYGERAIGKFRWSSIEDGMPTGDGNVRITVNNIVRTTYQIPQGDVDIDVTDYLSVGANTVKIRISDIYGQGKTMAITFNVTQLSISSPFDAGEKYTSVISVPVVPIGAVEKTIHSVVDGVDKVELVTSVSNKQMSFTIPAQSHGAHTLKIYFTAVINNETVRSNELYYEFIAIDPLSTETIIASSFNRATIQQHSTVPLTYTVYNPVSLTAEVKIYEGDSILSIQTVDRTEQSYAYRANTPGEKTLTIESGGKRKTLTTTVIESEIDVEAETEAQVLYLTSEGRSNKEEHPDTWISADTPTAYAAQFSGFNWVSDGWQQDSEGITVMRVAGDARITIPYKIFATDFRSTGKTIELEFATRNVLNYDSTILSCMSGGRGISVTAQKAQIYSEQSTIGTQYKEEEHNRISFVVEKRSENRLLSIYINGVESGCTRYPENDDFAQTNPVDISIGSSDCTIDIYNIRIYDNNLTSDQIVDNWIADTEDGATMLDRYTRNAINDAYGNIVISSLPAVLPYLIIECDELPGYKGDKKTCNIHFVHPLYPSRSFTSTGVQIDVQGTSSQYYPRKNFKTKHKNGFVNSSGSTIDDYVMNPQAIATNSFCYKADFASSEGANNVELARLYNDTCPYKTPAQVQNSKVRQGIDGFAMVVFWHDTVTDTTSFLGKYNFNNDKGTEEVFGFTNGDESWEILNNTSDRVLYKSADYSGTGYLNDFEARYPDTDPAYTNPAKLKEFADWIVTTDTAAATGDALPEPVTYGTGDDAVTYTNDTAEYRIAKFREEAGNYMELDSTLFYYLFTELFLMVDSRAKNAFPSFIGGAA